MSFSSLRPPSSYLDPEILQKLIDLSFESKSKAYCRYSQFPVGAALLAADGTIYTGCNVENGSYELAICAERTAIVKAISEGRNKFSAIVVASNLKNSYIVPCGACREFLTEFGLDWDVYMTKPDKTYLKMTVRELLPPYDISGHSNRCHVLEADCKTESTTKSTINAENCEEVSVANMIEV